MHKTKRIQSTLSFNRITGISIGLSNLYKASPRTPFVRATDRRVNKFPAEHRAKALQNTRPKPGQQMPGLWKAGAGESSMH